MDNYINENYNIVETYEKNKFQEILMGTENENPEEIILINKFKKAYFSDTLKDDLETSLKNLRYITESEEEVISVSRYNEGVPLKKYLKLNTLSKEDKNTLAEKYLEKIESFNNIETPLQKVLVDHNQIVMSDDDLHINELLLIDDPSIMDHKEVLKNISDTLKTILGPNTLSEKLIKNPSNYKNLYSILPAFNIEFKSDKDISTDKNVEEVDESTPEENEPSTLDTIENEITDDESIQESDNEKEIELDSLGFIGEEEDAEEPMEEESFFDDENNSNKTIYILLGIIALLVAGLLLSRIPQTNIFNDEQEVSEVPFDFVQSQADSSTFTFSANEEAKEFSKIRWRFFEAGKELELDGSTERDPKESLEITIKFPTEGSYQVVLEGLDSEGNWVKLYEINNLIVKITDMTPLDDEDREPQDETDSTETTEKLDQYTIIYETDNIIDDYEIKKSGDKSLKLDLTDGQKTAVITLSDILMNKEVSISYFIRSDAKEKVGIRLVGMSGEMEKFEKNIYWIPKKENVWELHNINLNTSNVDSLKIEITSSDATIWIDEISIDSYK